MTTPIDRRLFEADTAYKFGEIESQLEEGTQRMERIEAKLNEVYEIVVVAKGFFKVLGFVGKCVKWLMLIGGFFVAVKAAVLNKWW